jgi:DUF4097 and DUF4098 domain-containing protein YvlB
MIASAGCDIAMADFKEKQTAQWTKTYELQPGGRFELSNVNGRIEVQPASGNTIEVTAEKSARAGSVDAAKQALERIQIVENVGPGGVRLETRVNKAGSMFGGGGIEVRYTVRVPVGADVKLSTVNGGIELTGLSGRLNLETTNGGIKVSDVSGRLEANTTNGGVEVDLARVSEDGVKLGCTNGGIRLRLPADSKASINARITNGGIDTSGLQVETIGESSKRRLEARLNGGGPRIDIEGTNGGIRLIGR